MDWTIIQGALCKRGACSEWASGLSLAAEQSIEVGSRNMNMGVLQVALFKRRDVQSGQVGFPLLLNKALGGVKKHEYGRFTSGTLLKKGCSEWASGLSLAAEQSIEVGSRNMNIGFLQVALF